MAAHWRSTQTTRAPSAAKRPCTTRTEDQPRRWKATGNTWSLRPKPWMLTGSRSGLRSWRKLPRRRPLEQIKTNFSEREKRSHATHLKSSTVGILEDGISEHGISEHGISEHGVSE